mgnify:CR=1 FL=1
MTFFDNIYKLEAGYRILLKNGKFEKIKYWDVASYINSVSSDSNNSIQLNFEKLLKKAMELRNVSDVPISVALSGGLSLIHISEPTRQAEMSYGVVRM